MWRALQAYAKLLWIPPAIEMRLQDWRPKATLTVIAVGFALARGGSSRGLAVTTADRQSTIDIVVNMFFLALVVYSTLCSAFAVVKAFAFRSRPERPCLFVAGRFHLLLGLTATVAAIVHTLNFCVRCHREEEPGVVARGTALVCFACYLCNNLLALPMLFTVHGQLSSLVRLLATGLFINIVLITNGLVVMLGVSRPRWIYNTLALPMALLGVLYSLAEITVGWLAPSVNPSPRRSHARRRWRFGPLAALFQKGVRPARAFFRETVVTRFGFALGIPPVLAWAWAFSYADLEHFPERLEAEVPAPVRNAFVTAMVWASWQISVGTLLATLAMRGAIPYRTFYWLSDDFAVYVPFSGATAIWHAVSGYPGAHTAVGFVFAFWLPGLEPRAVAS